MKKTTLNILLINIFFLISFSNLSFGQTDLKIIKKSLNTPRNLSATEQVIESFDYPNADIKEVAKAISKLMKRNFILDPAVRGKITIIAPTQITVEEAYNAFLSALALNNLTIVKSGNFYKIRPTRDAKQDSIGLYTTKNFPKNDQLITRIIKIRYLNVDQIQKNITQLISKMGQVNAYKKTNSLIITDYGNNIARIVAIMKELDVPGFEEKLAVISVYHANAEKMSKLLNQIINPNKSRSGSSRFSRFSRNSSSSSNKSGAGSYSLVVPDERSNSIVVVGNKKGISKIRSLIKKLDTELSAEDAGGVYVYYVRHAEAEKIANVLNNLAKNIKSTKKSITPGTRNTFFRPRSSADNNKKDTSVLGENIKLTADKVTNSLIITANKQDYQTLLALLQKLDIPRDQVFVKAIIMEISADNSLNWGINALKFIKTPGGVSRVGFNTSSLANILNPINSIGAVLGFGGGAEIKLPNEVNGIKSVSSLMGLVELLKTTAQGNVLYTPQITAMDNEEALIKVGSKVPVAKTSSSSAAAGVSSGIEREEVAVELKFTPYINRENNSVRLKIDQKIQSISDLANTDIEKGVKTNIRQLKTLLTINDNDTAVLGGLTQNDNSNVETKIPLLGDIPLIGWLFKGVNRNKDRKNIMVFITPKIVKNESQQNDLFLEKLEERLSFIDKYLGNSKKIKKETHRILNTEFNNFSKKENNQYKNSSSSTINKTEQIEDELLIEDTNENQNFEDEEELLKEDNLDLQN
ncbi:MAG: type II secretion system secretin GspD [Bdellovibrionales bacterium]|nr:type II secretion system secretin GspD [Bdellovibrionales bacterium]